MKQLVRESLILFIIASVAAALLGFVYNATKPIIDENFAIAQQEAMSTVLPEATSFELVDDVELPENINSLNIGYDSSNNIVGYIVSCVTFGYGGQIDMMIGFNTDTSINHIDIIKHAETPGLGALATEDAFKSQFENKTGELSVTKSPTVGEQEISAITSSTITTKAVVGGTNDATNFITNYIGGIS